MKAKLLSIASVMFAALLLTGALSTAAYAQDYTTNTIAGSVKDLNGNPVAGATIEISSAKGVRRSATVGSDGSFRFPRLPLGEYEATVSASGFETLSDMQINNQLGVAGLLTITIAPEGAPIEEIVTTGVRQASVDFNTNETGISVNVGELMNKYPVGRDITSVALFAPGAQRGDTAFNTRRNGNLASFSGASVAENAYYINGMNVTNFRNFTGGSTIPFEFFDQIEVKTGGYQAEYGRSMGAFINSASKSGSNEFTFEATAYWTPDSLRETSKDIQTTWNSLDYTKGNDLILQASGPLWEDHLFFYGLYNDRSNYEQDFSSSQRVDTFDDDPFYAGKIDFVPFDGHRLEYTYFTDQRKIKQTTYAFNEANLDRDEVNGSEVGQSLGDSFILAGGTNEIFKYTGVFTDWFTISAMYGTNEFDRADQTTAGDCPIVYERMTNPGSSAAIGCWAGAYVGNGFDERESTRVDADFYFSALGEHHIRVGWDQEDLTSFDETAYSGGEYFRYHYCTDPNGCFNGQIAQNEEYVRHVIYNTGGSFEIQQSAWYIQDSWQLNDRLTMNIGFRSEVFENLNSNGEVFIKTDDEIAPRLGVTFDLFGDGRTLVSGFYGRYYMPIAANTNIRMSGAENYIEEYLRHNGYDERNSGTDIPTGVDYANPLQYNLISDGEIPDPSTIKAEQV
ncbi:MAG: carboxypeptidase regulatory-like domain-containing protein, partial [Woeseiaceae bacterium]